MERSKFELGQVVKIKAECRMPDEGNELYVIRSFPTPTTVDVSAVNQMNWPIPPMYRLPADILEAE